jgi:hypothetical protein
LSTFGLTSEGEFEAIPTSSHEEVRQLNPEALTSKIPNDCREAKWQLEQELRLLPFA